MRSIRVVWAGCAIGLMTPVLLSVAQSTSDAARGQAVFEKRCTGCHSLQRDRVGPRLQGVFGRTSGVIAGFPYSQELIKAHIVWNEKSLEQWLADPDTLVPGNNMEFHVAKAEERRAVIQFLKEASSN